MGREDGATSVRRNTATGGGGGGGCGVVTGGQVLKKGPWTAAEDAILMEYVKKHGEGNWNAVQRNSGLMRCGKSCRLRWANHLRPNLKKGAFTPQEEAQIIELHSKFGNKWARMALHLHGRTDNEIKNYWNTRLKRRLRAGLPIYPVNFQNHHRRHHEQPLNNQTSLFSSSNHGNSISPMLFEPFYVQNSKSQFKIIHSNTQFANSWLFDPSSLQSNNDTNRIPKTEPSFIEEITPQNSGGLLEDVLGKSRALISPRDYKGKDKIAHHDYSIMEDPQHVTLESVFEPNNTLVDDSCSGQSSIEIGVKSHSDVIDDLNVIDDDFSSWLDLPTGSLQDWYGGSEDGSNRNVNHVENSFSPVRTDDRDQDPDQDHDWTMGSCCWNKMPGFS